MHVSSYDSTYIFVIIMSIRYQSENISWTNRNKSQHRQHSLPWRCCLSARNKHQTSNINTQTNK